MKKKFKKKRVVISEKLKPVRPRASSLLHVKKERADIVGKLKSIRPLNDTEKIRLNKTLKKIEAAEYYGGGWNRVPGGFATARVGDADMETIDVHLEAGVKGGKTDTMKIDVDRKSMDVIGNSRITKDSTEITCKIVRMGGKDIQVCYNDKKEVEVYSGKNHIVDSSDPSHSKKYDLKETPPKYKVVVDELIKAHNKKLWGGGSMAKGGKFGSSDLPKDGSAIHINMPKMGYFPSEDIILKYDKKNFVFDVFKDGKREASVGEREVIDNLNNGLYVLKSSGGTMAKGGISGTLSTTYSDPIEYLKAMGAKVYSDLNYSTTNGINYYVGEKGDKAIVVAFIEDEENYMITKEDAREMSLTAKTKGINSVELYTNYGIELHSRLEKPKDIGFDKIYKVSVGGSMAAGGKMHDRMYAFMNDDLKKLEKAINEGNKEEVERFFSYWGQHLKSLKTKTNDRMYNFLKDDLQKLEKAIGEGDKEEVERFFSYWGQHLKSLKMEHGGSVETDGEISDNKRPSGLKRLSDYELYSWEDKPYHSPEETDRVHRNKIIVSSLEDAIKKATEMSSAKKYVEVYKRDEFVGSSRNGNKFIYGHNYRKHHPEAMGGSMATGGSIPNNYAGKKYSEVWDSWNHEQKKHFLLDHLNHELMPNRNEDAIKKITSKSSKEIADIIYSPNSIRDGVDYGNIHNYLISHVEQGQYSSGGSMATGGGVANKTWIVNIGMPGEEGTRLRKEEFVLGRMSDEEDVRQAILRKQHGSNGRFLGNGKVLSIVQKHASGSSMESGGSIQNNYQGKLAGDIWDSWTKAQKEHFLEDHLPQEVDIFGTHKYIDLPMYVQKAVIKHTSRGQYAGGGKLSNIETKAVDFYIKNIEKDIDEFWKEFKKEFKAQKAYVANTGGGIDVGIIPVDKKTIIGVGPDTGSVVKYTASEPMDPQDIFNDDDAIDNAVVLYEQFKNGGRMAIGGKAEIPRLKKDATWKEVKEYLEWLWNSPHRYHIDDNPYDVNNFTPEQQKVLKENSDIMWKFSEDGSKGTKLWDAYYKDELVE